MSSGTLANVRYRLEAASVYVFWAAAAYAVFYLAGTWLGSGGGQDPWTGGGPLAVLWLASLVVFTVGTGRHVASVVGVGGGRQPQ